MSRPQRPYPGLRPFQQEDREIFFGRDGYTMEILDRLARKNRFVAVIGESGSGKSSLVRAGVIPALHAGMLDGSSDPWMVARMTPGETPVRALAEALAEIEADIDPEMYPTRKEFELTLRHSSKGLVNAEKQVRRFGPKRGRLVLLVDQFEEVFRFGGHNPQQRNEAAAFVQLLVNAVAEPSTEIYTILTMRLDFLKDCAEFPRLSETLNTGQYLVPPMRREERRLAVTEPAKLFGKRVAPSLVERVLNEVGDAADQLPVMQHVMMRTWDLAGAAPELTLQHYETCGGAGKGLSKHANELFDALPDDDTRAVAETMFQALSVQRIDGRVVRRPQTQDRLMALVGPGPRSEERIEAVVQGFSGPGRDFLMRRGGGSRTLDITHEAILRVWDKLSGPTGWIAREAQEAETWRGLVFAAANFDRSQENVLKEGVLWDARAFWARRGRRLDWIQLYVGDENRDLAEQQIKEVGELIEASNAAEEVEQADRMRRRRRRALMRNGLWSLALLVSVGVGGFAILRAADFRNDADVALLFEQGVEAVQVANFTLAIDSFEELIEKSSEPVGVEVTDRLSSALYARARSSLLVDDMAQVAADMARVVELDAANEFEANAFLNPIRLELPTFQTRALPPLPQVLRPGELYYVVGLGSERVHVEAPKGLVVVETYSLFGEADSYLNLLDTQGSVVEQYDDNGFDPKSSLMVAVSDGETPINVGIGSHQKGGFKLQLDRVFDLDGPRALDFRRGVAEEMENRPSVLTPRAEAFVAIFETEQEQARMADLLRAEAYLGRAEDRSLTPFTIGALEDVNRAIALAGDEVVALASNFFIGDRLNAIAWQAFIDGNGPRQLRFVEAAIKLDPERAAYRDTQGQILIEAKQWQAAIDAFDADIALRGPSLHSLASRGYAYEQQGKKALAAADYRAALEPDLQNWGDEFVQAAIARATEGLARLTD